MTIIENTILQGNSLEKLKEIPDNFVDCIITSPPYFALRDYKHEQQIGQEKTINEYIDNLQSIFKECKRILKKTGTCWVVLGDTYSSQGGLSKPEHLAKANVGATKSGVQRGIRYFTNKKKLDIPEKSLYLIPERFALKMIENGWILRNKIIWHKKNSMPSPAKDRFTIDYEYIYFFTKSQKYYFKTQYEPLQEESIERANRNNDINQKSGYSGLNYTSRTNVGRIKRCVWQINLRPFSEAHFAVYPEQLVEQCLDAGCPEKICSNCNTPYITVNDEVRVNTRPATNTGNMKSGTEDDPNKELHNSDLSKYRQQIIRKNFKTVKTCECDTEQIKNGIVLDPFMGSGTTALVALKHNRRFIGIELNPDYIKMANKRIEPYLQQTKLEELEK